MPFRACSRAAALAAASLALAVAGPAAALPAERGLEGRVDAVLEPYVRSGAFDGVVLVAEGGRVVMLKPYGMANYELGVPNRPDTRFRIASLSKPVTDVALGLLLDAGKLTLDSKVSDFLPDFPRGGEITIRHLVTHSSGIAHTNDLPEYEAATRMTLAQSIAILKTKPLAFEPGADRSYSNGGYDVLAAIIEKAAGQPFESFVQTAVFDRLGMADTGWALTHRVIPGMADGYAPGPGYGERGRPRFYAPEIRRGGGALYSTARDMLTFVRAATTGPLLSEATRRSVILADPSKPKEWTGRAPGYSSFAYVDAARGIYVIGLANNYAGLADIGRRVYGAAMDQPVAVHSLVPSPRRLTRAEAARYEGAYSTVPFAPDVIYRLVVDAEGDLVLDDAVSGYRALMAPLGDGRWHLSVFDTICTEEGAARVEKFTCRSPVAADTFSYTVERRD